MPADASAAAEAVLSGQRRTGLRVALAVAAGFTWNLATGATVPFFGPVLAVQFLLGAGPLPLSKVVAFLGLVLVVGQAFILLNGIFGDHAFQLLALLGLFFFVCFFVQARGQGGPAIFLSLIIAITVTLLDRVRDTLDSSIISILLQAFLSAVALSWLAHAILPSHDAIAGARPQGAPVAERPALRALANATILLGAMTLCLINNALSTAIVLPITVASVLLQFDFATSVRSAFSLVAVNLLSGVLASLAFAFVELRPSLLFLFLTLFLVGLILGGRAAAGLTRMYAGALTTFLILFGSGISPLPTTTAESFSTRIGYVLLAVGYTLCMMALLWPRDRSVSRQLPLLSAARSNR